MTIATILGSKGNDLAYVRAGASVRGCKPPV